MRGYLEHAVRRGVNDKVAGAEMLLSVVVYHRRAGVRLVAKHAAPGLFFEFTYDLIGEAVREGRHRGGRDYTRYLPVTDGGILAARKLGKARNCAARVSGQHAAGYLFCLAVDVEKSEVCQARGIEART